MDLYFMEQLVTRKQSLEIHTLYYRTGWRASSNLYVRKIITFQEDGTITESWEGLFSRYGRRNSRALHPYNVKGWRPFPTLQALEQALYSHEFHPNRKPKSKSSQEENTKSSRSKKSRAPKSIEEAELLLRRRTLSS